MVDNYFNEEIYEHLEVAKATQKACKASFKLLLSACTKSIKNDWKIIFFGNGGSAADSQHLATELCIRYKANRPPISAIALTTDSSALTAAGNDLGFEECFSRQLAAIGRAGDVALGISTSGESENIIRALKQARTMNIIATGFSGNSGGRMAQLADPLLIVPSTTTARIQEMHIMLGQMLCGALEVKLGLV